VHVKEAGSTDIGEVVARARAGDRSAFDILVEQYTPRVYNVALRITGSQEEAQDCVQEAFIRAFSSLRHFRGEAAFSTWLYRVAVNVANDATRRLKSQPLLASEMVPAGSDDPPPDLDMAGIGMPEIEQPDEQVARGQRRDVILAAIRSLPEHQRAVVVLYDLQGLSYEEVAEVMGTRVGTVKSRLNRARLALKERLEPHLELLRS
jgi:RNA polymerase sigma-70 factor (ECF subfamily)